MQSLKQLYRYGMGPSSSHTMGPRRAAEIFRKNHPEAQAFRVHLYGSLSLTGKGHLTDRAIEDGLAPQPCTLIWHTEALDFHPNGMLFEALDSKDQVLGQWQVFSIGGGELREEGASEPESPNLYPYDSMEEMVSLSEKNRHSLWELVEKCEGKDIWDHLGFIWEKMQEAIRTGLAAEGVLPGGLELCRKAATSLERAKRLPLHENRTALVAAYSLAVSETNASGGFVVTAPTCGSCGVLPGVLFYLYGRGGHTPQDILKALATAGLVGSLVKKKASISGAEVGCQGEVGVASAMAAAAAAQLLGGQPRHVEYAAEMGLEHHLGLTCDPVAGLVQIPCIERNVFGAIRALACAEYALLFSGRHHVSLDQVVEVMKETGHDMQALYRETSLGGLARIYSKKSIPIRNSSFL
ncbi:L-serine ammonia-lyase [Desulfobotulus sp.]|uniref:L-serine ammonia-lyase n=1 Tax=Desulfobotulus sp. TaxID=1940337 RepID=UPI002A371EAA|nr:L-serine ammonia-lyase [Desulfobotulus sp.]MDY0163526.1 L-serine ammonia-lyase [Desulfobotulus sp.]